MIKMVSSLIFDSLDANRRAVALFPNLFTVFPLYFLTSEVFQSFVITGTVGESYF